MCGRGGHDYSWKQVYDYLRISSPPPEGGQHQLNIAPSTRRGGETHWTRIPVARPLSDGRRELASLVWPLVPQWANGELPKERKGDVGVRLRRLSNSRIHHPCFSR